MYLVKLQLASDTGRTPVLSRAQLSKETGISRGAIATTIQRLVANQHIRRSEVSNGWNCGGASFIVSRFAINRLLAEHSDSNTKGAPHSNTNNSDDSNTNPKQDVRSSSCTTLTTTTNNEAPDDVFLKSLVDKFDLADDFRLGANDLLDAWHASKIPLERFAESVEHIAFYLRSPEANGINSPRAWAIKKLRLGYYPEPSGFLSWEEQQLQRQIAAAQAKKERLLKARQEHFNLNYELWEMELTTERRQEILRPHGPFVVDNEVAARHYLRLAFAKQTGQSDLLGEMHEG